MGRLYGIDVPVDDALRLECDFALYQEDQVDCGVFDESAISGEENAKTWAAFIKVDDVPENQGTMITDEASEPEALVAKTGLDSDGVELSCMEDITQMADDISLA